MKKFLQRFFGIAVSAALVVSSGVTGVFAADPGHSHDDGKPISIDPDPAYTITLTHPDEKATFDGTNSHYGAYQIFSGTVNKTPSDSAISNPGSDLETHIPITDIKWGNAFGITKEMDPDGEDIANRVDLTARQTNIIGFVYALAKASTGSYSYAFNDFTDFNDLFDGNKLAAAYVNGAVDVTVTTDGSRVTNVTNPGFVNYDKLAVHIADVLVKPENIDDHEWLQAFNDILGGFGQGTTEGTYKNLGYVDRYYEGNVENAGKEYQIKVPAGYYMIRDLSSFEGEQSKSYSARMLFVADNVTQKLKESIPTLEKEIVRADGKLEETEVAGVGDDVKFQLKGTLPDNYDLYLGGYQYKFTDTLSNGLTLKEITADPKAYVTVTVKNAYNIKTGKYEDGPFTIDKTESANSTGAHPTHTVTTAYEEDYKSETNVLTVTFPCLKEIKIKNGDNEYILGALSEIYVDYTATVNQNAVVSPEDSTSMNGNTNKAILEYSDNPQSYGDTDTTKEDDATVYTFGLDIIKIDAAEYLRTDGTAALKDAKFAVVRPVKETSGITGWQIAEFETITEANVAVMDPKPTVKSFEKGYYSIVSWKNLTLTDVTDKSKFDVKWLDIEGNENYKTDSAYNIATLEGGFLNISGLDDGVTYTIAETETPKEEGKEVYAKIAPFTVTLKATPDTATNEYDGKLESAEVSNTIGNNESFSYEKFVQLVDPKSSDADNDGSANMLVANFKYIDLPSNGGVGTVWFYILGGGVLALSGVLFFLSKKKPTK